VTGLQSRTGGWVNIRRMADDNFAGSFGCDYCKWDDNRLYGHVTQIGSNELQHLIVLRCPKCGAFYSNTVDGDDQTQRLTEGEALELLDSPASAW
jgi:hypothetical protein